MTLSRLLDTSPHGTVLEPLGSHGSCHSKRADALSATTEQFLLLPVDHTDRGVNGLSPSLHGHYPASSLLRDSPPLRFRIRTLALVGLPLVASPLTSESQVPTFHSTASWQAQATSHAGRRSARKQVSSELIPQQLHDRGFGRHLRFRFDTSPVVPLQSSSCLSPDPVTSQPFPSAFTTVAFGQSRRRWFGACSCKPTPRGRPSSVEQLCTSSALRLFAVLVAHYNRETVDWNRALGQEFTCPTCRLRGH